MNWCRYRNIHMYSSFITFPLPIWTALSVILLGQDPLLISLHGVAVSKNHHCPVHFSPGWSMDTRRVETISAGLEEGEVSPGGRTWGMPLLHADPYFYYYIPGECMTKEHCYYTRDVPVNAAGEIAWILFGKGNIKCFSSGLLLGIFAIMSSETGLCAH